MAMSVVMAVDRPGWSFYNIASKVIQYHTQKYPNDYRFSINIGSSMRNETADVVIVFKWDQFAKIMKENNFKRGVFCVYDHVTWNKTKEDEFALQHALKKADFIIAGNHNIAADMRVRDLDPVPIIVCEDGVECNEFKVSLHPAQFTIGWNGNSSHGWGGIKGLDLIKEACNMTKTNLVISDTSGNNVIPRQEMPAWYEGISAYVCASIAEGTPCPVLEAMSCGRPVITTRVGITERLVIDGVNGYFCDRTAESIAEKIMLIRGDGARTPAELGHMARLAAECYNWTYKMRNWRLALNAISVTL